MLLYLVGVATGLAWLLLGCWGVGWITRRSTEPSPATLALYDSLPYLGLGKRPRLRIAGRVRRPVLLGTLRQTILIPAQLDEAAAAPQLRLSLLHELAHSESADPWFLLTGGLAQAFWFYLPPMWWIRAQMRLDHEFLADRRAAHGFGPTSHYASSLVDLASPEVASEAVSARSLPRSSLEPSVSALFLRVLMLIRCPFPLEASPPVWWSWSLPGLIVMATLAASCLSLRIPTRPLEQKPHCAGPRIGKPRVFRVATLAVPARPAHSHGRAPLFELPIRLPTQFDLTLDVWAAPMTLPHSRVVGLRLADPPPSPSQPRAATTAQPQWNRVRIRRDGSGVTISVNEARLIPPTDGTSLTTWLSVEPAPDEPGRYQNMILTW
jgi:hypothetical protein